MDTLFLKRVSLKKGAHLDRSGYLYRIPALRGFRSLVFSSPVTFFTGENGAGKSTLLEAVAVALGFNPEGGSRNFLFHSRDTHSALWSMLELVRGPYRPRDGYFVRAESFYNLATNIDEPRRNARLFPSAHPFLRREIAARSVPRGELPRAFSQPLRRAGALPARRTRRPPSPLPSSWRCFAG